MLAALAGKLSFVACAALVAAAVLLATGCGGASAGPSGPVRLDHEPPDRLRCVQGNAFPFASVAPASRASTSEPGIP